MSNHQNVPSFTPDSTSSMSSSSVDADTDICTNADSKVDTDFNTDIASSTKALLYTNSSRPPEINERLGAVAEVLALGLLRLRTGKY